ncbi:MAG: thiol reductant ABC exporter subunit CydD, partial [Caldilineae bacterium]
MQTRLFRQTEAARLALGLTVGLGAGAGVAAAGQAFGLSRVVNRVFLAGDGLPEVAGWLWGLLALSLLRAALTWGSRAAGGRLAGRIQTDLRDRLTAHLLALGPAFAGGERTGELVNTAVEGVAALDAWFRRYLPQLALAAILPLAILAIVFPLDPLSGAVFLLTAPLIPLFMVLIGSWADGLARRRWVSLSRMSAHFLDVLQGLTTLKLLGRSREQMDVIARVSDRLRQTTMDVLRVAFLSAMALELVATLSTAVVAVEIGLRLLYGRMAFEPALFILMLAPQFYLPLRRLGTHFHAGTAGAAAAKRIFQVLDTPLPPAVGLA